MVRAVVVACRPVGSAALVTGQFSVAVPAGWDQYVPNDPGVRLVALEPEHGGFRSNIVIAAGDLGGMSLRDWQIGTDGVLPRMLEDYLLLDLEHVLVGGHPGVRRLAHHAAEGQAVTMEQWAVVLDDVGWTLTATVPSLSYDVVTDEVARIAGAWRVSP